MVWATVLVIEIIDTTDFGDCPPIGNLQTIDFRRLSIYELALSRKLISNTIYQTELCEQPQAIIKADVSVFNYRTHEDSN